jgi:hypothetical protein
MENFISSHNYLQQPRSGNGRLLLELLELLLRLRQRMMKTR